MALYPSKHQAATRAQKDFFSVGVLVLFSNQFSVLQMFRYERGSDRRSRVPFYSAQTLKDTRGIINAWRGFDHPSCAQNNGVLTLRRRVRGPSGQEQETPEYASSTARRGSSLQNPDQCFPPGATRNGGKPRQLEVNTYHPVHYPSLEK